MNVSLAIYCLITSFIICLVVTNSRFIKYFLPTNTLLLILLCYNLIFGFDDIQGVMIALSAPFAIAMAILIFFVMRLTNLLINEREQLTYVVQEHHLSKLHENQLYSSFDSLAIGIALF